MTRFGIYAKVLRNFMTNNDLAVVVLSCDKFSSLWALFFKRLDRNFPTNFAKVYLLSNHIDLDVKSDHALEVVCVGDDISWSANLRKLLIGISEPNVLLLMDDAPLSQVVEVEEFQHFYSSFIEHKMNYLNLKASPAPNSNIGDYFGEILPSTCYRTAVIPSFWRKDILLYLLKDDENAWQFEINGSTRSERYQGFYSVKKPVLSFDHIVIKGKVDRGIFKKLKNNDEHIGIDFPVMSVWEYFKEKMSKVRAQIVRRMVPDFITSAYRKIKYNN